MAKFLLDANLAPGLALRLSVHGFDCLHVSQYLPPFARDIEIADVANRIGVVLITKDADFSDLKKRGILKGGLIWLRSGNMSNRGTAKLLLTAVPQIVIAFGAGETEFEVR